jgi:NADH-quinone oxidoreductase subunit G
MPGRDTEAILAAVINGEIDALVVAGVDPADLPDPVAALAAIEQAGFVVSLELRASAVTDRADVVLPVAAVAEKAGTFLNWEGRAGQFEAALPVPGVRGDLQVLGGIADAMDVHLGLPDAAAARRELATLGVTAGRGDRGIVSPRPARPASSPARGLGTRLSPGAGEALLATWHNLLDAGRMQDGEPNLAGTARAAVAKMSAATAAEADVADGGKVTVATRRGAITVPVEVTAAMPDRVVWLPANSAGCAVRGQLGAGHGTLVMLRSAE